MGRVRQVERDGAGLLVAVAPLVDRRGASAEAVLAHQDRVTPTPIDAAA